MFRSRPVRATGAIVAATNGILTSLRLRQPASPPAIRACAIYEPLESRRLLSVNVTTYHYDNARDGANTNETVLTPANVNTGTFGKVASFPVDAQVYAQPLVMTGIPIPGQGTRDIVLVATENDSVYAFDAEGNNPAPGYLWKTSLLQAGETAVPQTDYQTTDITPLIGITGTPVVDSSTDTLYVVGAFKEANASYQQRLYALDITDGAVKFGGPATIAASVPGMGYSNVSGAVSFSPFWENQRPALTLANGNVYIAWSSHGDLNPWHGWVIAYNASNLQQDYVYCDTANGDAGGIWMSGGGIAVDSSGNLYFTTGNGDFDPTEGNYGMSLEKLSPSLTVEDYFAPYNQAELSDQDLDYGCSSVILLPTQSDPAAPNEILTESKWGTMFLNNGATGDLGEYNSNGTGPNDDLSEVNINGTMHNTISYWNGTAYVGGDGMPLEAYSVGGGQLGQSISSESANSFGTAAESDGQGASVTISSNGTANGIVWAIDNSGFKSSPAVLYAYNANNLSQMLWNSNQASGSRDTGAGAVKFQTAVVANGYVYVGGAGSVTVYGLLHASSAPPTLVAPAAASPSTVTGTTTSVSVLGSDPAGDPSPVYVWSASTVPAGAAQPSFSANGTSAASSSTATFYHAGSYTLTVTIEDPYSGYTTISSVNVTVNQTFTSIAIAPSTAIVSDTGTRQFTATGYDQFGIALASQPGVTWSVNAGGAGGSVNSSGMYTAPATATGTDIVTATSGSISATATVSVYSPSATIEVNLSSNYNAIGIVTDGVPFGSGLDGEDALSGNLLGTSQAWNQNTFVIPAATSNNSVNNVVECTGQTIPLSQNNYSAIKFLATKIGGGASGVGFTVNYRDGSTQIFTQGFSDWAQPQGFSGESDVVDMPYRDVNDGSRDSTYFHIYGYTFVLNSGKAIQSVTLPTSSGLVIVAMDLMGVTGVPPMVTSPASASPSVISGTTTNLCAAGTDTAGDASPIYTWAATNMPGGVMAPSFSVNGTTAANMSTATFYQAGSYTFMVTITDPSVELSSTSSVNVTVSQTMNAIVVTPGGPITLGSGQSQQLSAVAVDKFGTSLAQQPTFTWSIVSGVGSVGTSGLYQAPGGSTGTATIQATANGFTAQATVQVTSAGTAYFYPTQAGWWRSGVWQGTSGTDGGSEYTSPAGNTVLLTKNPTSGGTLRDAYLLFNISNLAFAGDAISSVTLTFNAAALNEAGPVALGVYGMSNTSWGASTTDPSPAPTYAGSTEIGTTQNVGGTQGTYVSYNFSLGNYITNATNGVISLELNSPAATSQITGFEIDSALDTVGVDPVITVNYTARPAWLGVGSQATWNSSTRVLTVTGATSIVADPGADQPIIQANGSSAVVTINPTSGLQIHLGGLCLANGSSAIVTSLGSARTATNHRVLVLGLPNAITIPLFSIDSSSKLDLTDNDLVDHDGNFTAVNNLLKGGYNAGAGYWNGHGIVSSNAAAGTLFTLGEGQPASATTFDNESVGTSDVELRYTYYGDANLDGHVDGSDYSDIDNGYFRLTGFNNGDFNYDGVVNGSDYTLIDNAFNTQGASLAAEIATPSDRVAGATTVTLPAGFAAMTTEAVATKGDVQNRSAAWIDIATKAQGTTAKNQVAATVPPKQQNEVRTNPRVGFYGTSVSETRRSKTTKSVSPLNFSSVNIVFGDD